MAETIDFDALKRTSEAQDVEAWLGYYDDRAEWTEDRHANPPRNPNRMVGREQIESFLRVKGSHVQLSISDDVVGAELGCDCLSCVLPNGGRIIPQCLVFRTTAFPLPTRHVASPMPGRCVGPPAAQSTATQLQDGLGTITRSNHE